MPQYGYIPIGNLQQNDTVIESILVRLTTFVLGKYPTVYDSEVMGIHNILELEDAVLTETQRLRIAELQGQWFPDAISYLEWKAWIAENPEQAPNN
jgi:hypothetical protein